MKKILLLLFLGLAACRSSSAPKSEAPPIPVKQVEGVAPPAEKNSDCNQEQALNKMMVLGKFNNQFNSEMQKYPIGSEGWRKYEKLLSEFSKRLTGAGPLLAEGKYQEACQVYDALIRDFKVDYVQESKGVLTVEELKSSGGRREGSVCDLTEAALKAHAMAEVYAKKFEAGAISEKMSQAYNQEMTESGTLMAFDPGKACERMDQIREKYPFFK